MKSTAKSERKRRSKASPAGETYKIETLAPRHRVEKFSSGEPAIDKYFQQQAPRDVRKKMAGVFVLADRKHVAGFYVLAAHVVYLQAFPPGMAPQLPRAPVLSATLLQHLAVRRESAPEIKEFLLVDALRRALEVAPRTGSCAVVVKVHYNLGEYLEEDEEEQFYSRYGFLDLGEDRMWLPMKTVAKLFAKNG